MVEAAPPSFHRYDHIDADPSAAPGSAQRLKWEFVCARLDADAYLRRARLVSADGHLSRRDQSQFQCLLAASMAKSSELRRALESEAAKAAAGTPLNGASRIGIERS